MEDTFDDEFDIFKLTKEELDKVDYDKAKWHCCVEGCMRFTRIRDYGVSPSYYTCWGWLNLTNRVMYCGKHTRLERQGLLPPDTIFKDGPGINHISIT